MTYKKFIFAFCLAATCLSSSSWRSLRSIPVSLQVPITPQSTSYSCGAAAFMSVLYYWREYDGNEQKLMKMLGTSEEQGTYSHKIRDVAIKKFGLQASIEENLEINDLKNYLEEGKTVILLLQAWRDGTEAKLPWSKVWESGHDVVLVGIDDDKVYFMDPSTADGYTFISRKEFEDRWHDYEIINNKRKIYNHTGIVISGKTHLGEYPTVISEMQ